MHVFLGCRPAIPDEEQGGDRKKWGGGGKLQLGNLPLQETASGMEGELWSYKIK